MVPSKSKRSSTRRSSILKPPKPRHPLQNLNFTCSSAENSPVTTKIKRRVSFAEKKHVKEFCNSLEQGTVWNNTYEEHDLSSQKALHSPNREEYNVECSQKENSNSEVAQACSIQESIVGTISSETCNTNENVDDFELSFTNVVQSAESMLSLLNQKDVLSNAPFAMLENSEARKSILGSSIPVKNTSHVSQPITVYEDPDDVPNKVSELPQSDLNTLQCNKLNTTAVQDTRMEFTEVVSNAEYRDFKTMVPNTTMEFTEAIPASLNILEDKENIRDPDLRYRLITSNTVATTEEHCDMSMELTSAIPPSIIKSINDVETTVYSVNDKTKLSDLSMEITAALSNIPCNLQIENCNINSIPNDDDNRNAIFNDVSMEMTEAVKTNPPKDMTCLINDCNRLVVSQNVPKYTDNVTNMNEKTELLNLPMEITAVIPGTICLMNDNEDNIKSDVKGSRDNGSSEMLEQCDKTKICNNEAMEFTTAIEAVPTTNFYNLKDNGENTDINLYTDKTRIFLNNSMTVTAVVSSLNSKDIHEEELIARESNNQNSTRTALFPNTSMEMTEVIEKPQYNIEVENPIIPTEVNIDKTKICNNEPMEFTRAIEVLPTTNSNNLNDNNEYNDINLYTDKTRIFLNNSMTVTAVVSKDNHEEEVIARESNNRNSTRTALFPNTSMEMTEVIEKPQYNIEVENPIIPTEVNIDKTKICNNEPMEFTRAIEVLPTTNSNNLNDNNEYNDINLYTDKTRIFLNNSMTVTAVVSKDQESINQNSTRTALFPSTPMEMTEVVEKPQYNMEVENPIIPTEVNIDKTKICNNEPMEFTSAIEVLPTTNSNNLNDNNEYNDINLYTDKTRIFLNNSMTVTAVVSKDQESINQNSTRTALFPSTPMEMTEVVEKPQYNMEVENPVVSTEVRQSELPGDPEAIPRRLNQSPVSMNILKDITRVVVPSVFDSKSGSEKGDPAVNNSAENIIVDIGKETPVDDAQKTVSLAPSTALHESNDKDASSALKESNTVAACAPINPVLSDALPAINSTDRTRDIRFNPRRTYTIQQSDVDHSCTIANEKNDRSFQLDTRTFSYNANNNENSVRVGQTKAGNSTNNLQEYDDLIVHGSSENLESIDPPSFLCSDNSFSNDVDADVIHDQEVGTKSIENVTNLNTMCNNLENIIEPVYIPEMCLIKSMSAGTDENKSIIEHAGQAQPNEAAACLLSRASCSSTDSSILKLTSSTINDSNKLPKFTIEKDCQDANDRMDIYEEGDLSTQNIQSLPGNSNLSSNSRLNTDKNLLIVADTEMTDANEENSKGTIESHTCSMEKDVSVVLDPFSALLNKLKLHSESDDIIWSVYHENIERNMFAIGFIACSLLVVIFLTDDCDATSNRRIKEIKVISRLADDSDALLCTVHRLILEKLDATGMMILYETEENILPMLDYISGEVKMAMDFMFDVKRSFDLNLMQINRNSISFVSWTSRMDIILKIQINIKPFDRIEARDISVQCLLGSVREEDIRKLIKNIKRDHTFVRRFMNDVQDYIYIIEDSAVKTTY